MNKISKNSVILKGNGLAIIEFCHYFPEKVLRFWDVNLDGDF